MIASASDNPTALLTAAQRLRGARVACRRFLLLWAMSSAKGFPQAERGNLEHDGLGDDPEAMLREMKESKNHDWSVLYRGGVLDD
jgi:hypothetical protein